MSESSSAPGRGRYAWRWLSIAAGGLVAALLVWKLPQWQTDPWRALLAPRDLLLVENARRQTVLLLLGVGLIAAALLLLWRYLAARERAVRAAAEGAEESRRSERFIAAIGQLADARLEVRVGAIYGLEQLARESVEQHWPIMEVLCAYVRTRAAWDPDRAAPARQPTDIQAVLTVLGRRRRRREQEGALDLQHTDLRGADLHELHLERAVLRAAHLEGANLQAAHLVAADLRGAVLSRADAVDSYFMGADLREAHLECAYLVDAHLEGVDLGGAYLGGAYLGGAFLEGADLGGAHLEGAYLYKAHLEGATLGGAKVLQASACAATSPTAPGGLPRRSCLRRRFDRRRVREEIRRPGRSPYARAAGAADRATRVRRAAAATAEAACSTPGPPVASRR